MDTKELKKIAAKYTLKELEACISEQLNKGENACDLVDETDTVISELSKATVVRELMEKGASFSEALRELGKRIRFVYGGPEEIKDKHD